MKHEFRVISKQEIEQTRAKAYKYINFDNNETTSNITIPNHTDKL